MDQPEVLLFNGGAILAFIPVCLVQHAEVLWVGATGYGVLTDTILMLVDPPNTSAKFLGPRETRFSLHLLLGCLQMKFSTCMIFQNLELQIYRLLGLQNYQILQIWKKEPRLRQRESLGLKLN